MSNKVLAIIIKGEPGSPTSPTWYLATDGFLTATTDTPGITIFDGRITRSPEYSRAVTCFFWGGGSSGVNIGAVDLINNDGELDAMLEGASLRDTEVLLLVGAPGDAFHENGGADWELVATAVVDRVEAISRTIIRVNLVDRSGFLDKPLQTNLYTSVGNTALNGKPIPIALGSPKSCPIPLVEPSTLDFDLNDGAFVGIDKVRDQGVDIVVTSGYIRSIAQAIHGITKQTSIEGKIVADISGALMIDGADVLAGVGAFTNWTADDPDGWTVAEDANNYITENPTGEAQYIGVNDATRPGMITADGSAVTSGEYYYWEMDITAQANDSLELLHGFTSIQSGISAVGWHRGVFTAALTTYINLRSSQNAVIDITVDDLTVLPVRATDDLTPFIDYLMDRATVTDIDTASIAALDAKTGYTLNYWADSPVTVDRIMTELMDSFGGWYYFNRVNDLTVGRLEDPADASPGASSLLTITDNDIKGGAGALSIRQDFAPGLSNVLAYSRNWFVHNDADIAGSVSATERALINTDYRGRAVSATALPVWHEGALGGRDNIEQSGVPTLLTDSTDAQAEVDRWADLYSVDRFFYTAHIVSNDDLLTLEPGNVVTLKVPRFGLDAGVPLMVVATASNFLSNTFRVTLWG